MNATNDKSRDGRGDPVLLAQTARKHKAGGDCDYLSLSVA